MARSLSRNHPSFGRTGLSASNPSSSASSATGERCIFLPRPTGASGRVTTAATVCLDAASARSVGSAGGGVPAKTSRTARSLGDPLGGVRRDLDLRDGHARPLGLADGLHRELALLLVEPVDEQDAVEVIRLMLDAAGE